MNDTFQAWLARFFESYYRHRPVNATFIGEHRFDHVSPDYSATGVAAALADADALLRDASAIEVAALSPVERIDKRLAEGYLRIQQWEFAAQHFQRGNPSLYTGEAIFGVIGLFLTEYAPFAERAAAAIDRMRAIGALLEQGAQNVRQARCRGPNVRCANARARRRFSEVGSTRLRSKIQPCSRRSGPPPISLWPPLRAMKPTCATNWLRRRSRRLPPVRRRSI